MSDKLGGFRSFRSQELEGLLPVDRRAQFFGRRVRDALVDVRCGRAIDYQAEQFGPTVVTARVHNPLASIDLSKVKICDHFTFTSCEGLTDNLALWIDNGGEAATGNRPHSTTRILHDLGLLIGIEPRRRIDDKAGSFE